MFLVKCADSNFIEYVSVSNIINIKILVFVSLYTKQGTRNNKDYVYQLINSTSQCILLQIHCRFFAVEAAATSGRQRRCRVERREQSKEQRRGGGAAETRAEPRQETSRDKAEAETETEPRGGGDSE